MKITVYRLCSVAWGLEINIASHRIASHRIASHASHRIASHRIASYRIVSYRIVSYRIVKGCVGQILPTYTIIEDMSSLCMPRPHIHVTALAYG